VPVTHEAVLADPSAESLAGERPPADPLGGDAVTLGDPLADDGMFSDVATGDPVHPASSAASAAAAVTATALRGG
jgi:hypothetical protein